MGPAVRTSAADSRRRIVTSADACAVATLLCAAWGARLITLLPTERRIPRTGAASARRVTRPAARRRGCRAGAAPRGRGRADLAARRLGDGERKRLVDPQQLFEDLQRRAPHVSAAPGARRHGVLR
jgi:hypothetical protein